MAASYFTLVRIVVRSAALTALSQVCALAARADSLTITYNDMTAMVTNTTSVTSPPGSPLPPGVFGATLDNSYGSISYHVEGTANPPGSTIDSPTAAYLSSTQFSLTNTSATSHHIVITFDAQTFTLPVANQVMISTQLTTNDSGGRDTSASHPSTLTASALGGLIYSRTESLGHDDVSPVVVGPMSKTGNYELKQVYDFWVVSNPGVGDSVKSFMNMDVLAGPGEPFAPEPWAITSLATMLPVAGAYFFRRRNRALST